MKQCAKPIASKRQQRHVCPKTTRDVRVVLQIKDSGHVQIVSYQKQTH